MLEIKNLSITFNKQTANDKKALNNLSLHLNEGDFVTIIGSNGAGKSTLLNCISGSYQNDEGSIDLNGSAIHTLKEHKRAQHIGRLFQDPLKGTAPNMSIEENLELAYRRGNLTQNFYTRFLKVKISKEEKELFKSKLSLLELGLEERMKSKVGLLSGGQRQALTLLMATIIPPTLLLLDEHTAALDPKTAAKVMDITNKIIKKNNTTTFMITHNIKHALAYGNRMIVMSEGKIVMDINDEDKKKMSVEDVMKLYATLSVQEFSDKMILD